MKRKFKQKFVNISTNINNGLKSLNIKKTMTYKVRDPVLDRHNNLAG